MYFLNPPVLIGLLAVSIPILIHLLNLRKIRKVEFSTLMFLKEIQKSKMRRIKLKQLLLLLLRILAIVFLVLCFARPVYEGYAGGGNEMKSTVVIVADNSFSMSARDNNGTYLTQAKEAVRKILDAHRESDEIYFAATSSIPVKESKIFFDGFKDLIDSLENVKISERHCSLNEVIEFSERIFRDSKTPSKELYIISDFQKSNFDSEPLLKDAGLNGEQINVYLVKTGNREVRNLSLDSFSVTTKILEKDKNVKVNISVRNHSEFNVTNKTVNLYVDGELKDEKSIDIGSNSSKETEFVFKSDKTGSLDAMIELVQSGFEEDEILQDNKYFFSMYIPDRFNIGLIDDNPQDSYYINLALETAENAFSDSLKSSSRLFNIKRLNSVNSDIFSNNVVLISDKKSFTDSEAEIIKDYVSNGGGIFLFLGSSVDINNYNATILSKLNTARIDKVNYDKYSNELLKFEKMDFENPLLSEVFTNKNLNITADRFNIDAPKINSYHKLLLNSTTSPIITLTNNDAFLVESGLAKGKVIVASVDASGNFSDLPFKSLFVPLIIRSIYYLSNNFQYQTDYIVGKSNLVSATGLGNIAGITLPGKEVVKLGKSFYSESENYLFLPYSNYTTQSGNYALFDSSGRNFGFALNVDPLESLPEVMSEDELTEYFGKNGFSNVKVVATDEQIADAIKQSRDSYGLWKYFLVAAILMIAAEILLSKKLEGGGES